MENALLVFVGGGLGAVSRYLVTTSAVARMIAGFPLGTLTVNIVGSLLMGFITYYFVARSMLVPEHLRLLLLVGFMGGFTTFSSFSLETLTLLQNNAYVGIINIAANVLLCILAAALGMWLARGMVA